MADQEKKADGSITSYCIEHALTQQSKCASCEKTIPHKSLRVAEIYRKSKKVKKDKARHTWYHFKCWKGKELQLIQVPFKKIKQLISVVPEYLTRIPIEQFRGFKALNEKDKARVERVIKSGVGSSWAALMEKAKPIKTEEELEADKEEQAKKDKKKKEDEESMNMDMTEVLTGTQQKSDAKKKAAKKEAPVAVPVEKKVTEKKKGAEKKDTLKAKTDKKNKVTKKPSKDVTPAKPKEIKLPKEDMMELENFAKEFSAFK